MGKVFFVDCFNTVICRRSSANEVIFDWCRDLGNKYSVEPVVFYKLFYKYMFKLAKHNLLKIREAELKFSDVLKLIHNVLQSQEKNLDFETFEQYATESYKKAESRSHFLNEEFVEQLKKFKNDEGVKIYLVSEFYCGKEVLRHWLQNLGIANLFDDIFVSCDFMLSKRSGRLYKKIINDLALKKKDITMFGDNSVSDIFGARLVGLKAKKVATKILKPSKHFKKLIKCGSDFQKYEEIFSQFGWKYNYSNYCFPVYLFVKRLCRILEQRGVKNVFFLSREGMFLKKLFDNYCQLTNSGKDIKTHYFLVSRNSLYRASLKPLGEQDFTYLMHRSWTMSVVRFLSSLDFSNEEVALVNKEVKANFKRSYLNFEKTKVFKKILNAESFKQIYATKLSGQRQAFELYLNSFGADLEKEGFHIVDVGWRGTMQDILNQYFDGKVGVFGYFIGYVKYIYFRNKLFTLENKNPSDDLAKTKSGLITHTGNKTQFGNNALLPMLTVYEQIFRANHNRVTGYEIHDGEATVTFSNTPDEAKIHQKYILPLQIQIEEKFNKLCQLEKKHFSFVEPITVQMYHRMVKRVSREDLNMLFCAQDSYLDNFAYVGNNLGFSHLLKYAGYGLVGFFHTLKTAYIAKNALRKYLRWIEKQSFSKRCWDDIVSNKS